MKKPLLMLALLPWSLLAQVPSMIKDITPGGGSSYLGNFKTLANQSVLFVGGGSVAATSGLWVTDGSTAGTVLLKQLMNMSMIGEFQGSHYIGGKGTSAVYSLWKTNGTHAGTDSIALPGVTGITSLMSNTAALMFVATNSGSGKQLWRSDGTAAGTYSLIALDNITTCTVVSNILFFMGSTSATGTEPYRSDGTVAGTFLLKDVRAGVGSSAGSAPLLRGYNNELFMLLNDGTSGDELWKSDGTSAGTILVKDIFPGSGSSAISINTFYVGNNGLYFMANNQVNGPEPWFSDGIPANTTMIGDLNPGTGGSFMGDPTFVGSNAYFMYQQAIYKTDGTAAGTTSLNVSKHYPTSPNHVIYDRKLRLYNNDLYFVSFVADQNMSGPVNDTVMFSKVDLGLTARTVVGKLNHYYPSGGGMIMNQIVIGSTQIGSHFLYMYTSNELNIAIFNPATGNHKLFNKMGSVSGIFITHPYDHQPLGNKFYFPHNKNGITPGYLDLTNDSIYPLNSGSVGYNCSNNNFTWRYDGYNLNNKTYFLAAEAGYGLEWFGTDYTAAGTSRLLDINPGSGDFDNGNTQNLCLSADFLIWQTGNNLYFGADDGAHGFELWSVLTTTGQPVAVGPQQQVDAITLFPNPAGEVVNVTTSVPLKSASIYDLVGKFIRSEAMTGSKKISLSGLPPGLYFLQISTETSTETFRIIKE